MAAPSSAAKLQTGIPNSSVPIGRTQQSASTPPMPVIVEKAWLYFLSTVVTFVQGSLGYRSGQGGSATQATDKTTSVEINAPCGQITMHATSLAAGATVTFTLENVFIAAGDVLVLNHLSGGTAGKYVLNAQSAAGSANINVTNRGAGALAEAIVIAFALVKATSA